MSRDTRARFNLLATHVTTSPGSLLELTDLAAASADAASSGMIVSRVQGATLTLAAIQRDKYALNVC